MAKRFIAGAVCPKCELMDKIYVEQGVDVATCAACGYQLTQTEDEPEPLSEEKAIDQAVTLVNFKNNQNKQDK